MSYLQTVVWGIVVGLTEILPVSGSAHIAFLEKIFGIQRAQTPQWLFYAMLDFALLIAIVLTCRHEVAALLRGVSGLFAKKQAAARRPADRTDQRLVLMVAVGLLPLLLELLLQRWTNALYGKPLFWAACLIVSGLGLFFCEYLARGSKDARQMRLSDAVMVGVAQAVAVLPGLSRMGLMLCAGYRRGFQPAFSVQYAFLLSIPFLLGAGIGNVDRGLQAGVQTAAIPAYLVGMAVCVLAAIGAIQLLHRALSRKKLSICAFYCWGAAAFSLFLFLIT